VSSESDIFNIDCIDDVPHELKKEILGERYRAGIGSVSILKLFNVKAQLSVDEILIGLYRKFGIKKNRRWVSLTMHNLCKNKHCEPIGHGIWILK